MSCFGSVWLPEHCVAAPPWSYVRQVEAEGRVESITFRHCSLAIFRRAFISLTGTTLDSSAASLRPGHSNWVLKPSQYYTACLRNFLPNKSEFLMLTFFIFQLDRVNTKRLNKLVQSLYHSNWRKWKYLDLHMIKKLGIVTLSLLLTKNGTSPCLKLEH